MNARFARQFTAAASVYDHASPDESEDGYSTDDAQCDVAQNLIDMDEVGAVVADLYDAKALLNWIAQHVDIPNQHLSAFRAIDRRVSGIWKSVNELEVQHA